MKERTVFSVLIGKLLSKCLLKEELNGTLGFVGSHPLWNYLLRIVK